MSSLAGKYSYLSINKFSANFIFHKIIYIYIFSDRDRETETEGHTDRKLKIIS